ncbi:MAG TPA: hypothetical protein VFM58_11430, partial [Solirubrobacteraceae bacterium]|nr:hypothetical protein [Solirubrobacteraceae bacterium]
MLPTYSVAERNRRWELAQQLMDLEGLDALLVWGEREGAAPAPFAFDTYFTNDRPGALVVIPRGAEPVALVPLPMYVGDHYESTLRGDELWIAPENVRVARHPAGVAGVLREHGADRGRIGVVGAEPYPPYYFVPPLPAALRLGLAKQLPDADLVPAGHRLAALTMRQSDEELAVIRHAAGIGDAMAVAMREATAPGVPETEVYAAGLHAAHVRG